MGLVRAGREEAGACSSNQVDRACAQQGTLWGRGQVGSCGGHTGVGWRDQLPGSPGTATHIVPLRLELLLLEALVLPEVADVGQGFPDDQQEDTNQHNSCHGASHDGSNVGAHWTL